MPSYKFDSESDSDPEDGQVPQPDPPTSDDGEPGPDDTFHFRQSFSKASSRPRRHVPVPPPLDDEDMLDNPFFQAEEEEDLYGDIPEQDEYDDEMPQQLYSDDAESLFSDEEGDEEVTHDPVAASVRIEKRATWLEQIEYTDRAIKRLKAIDTRERLQNEKVHWGGQVPEIKYSTEDLERDLFGDHTKTKKRSGFDYLQAEALKQGIFDQKSWDAKEMEKGKPNPAFRLRWGVGDVLIHRPNLRNRALDEGAISFKKLQLSTLEEDAAKKQAQRLLERQLQHTTFTTDPSGIPLATPSSTLEFRTFYDTLSLTGSQPRSTDEYESHLWHLASILFDSLPPPSSQPPNEQILRKRELSIFFKDLVSRSVWTDFSRTRDPAERIFLNLTGYRISDACVEATKTKDLHLATLLALAEESTREYRQDLARQLEVWRKDGSWSEIQLWYRAVYELLAGQVDGRGNALGQLGVGGKVDWRRAFAMRLWFGTEADAGIKDAVQEYWMACSHDESVAKPVPWYITGGNTGRTGVWDGMFQLLRLYAGQGGMTTLDDVLNSYNYTSTVTDVRIPWHLYVILHQLRGTASFSDTFGAKGGSISETGERLTLSYICQLENLGLWHWAIFVALHLRRASARKGVIMDVLARRMAILPTSLEEQGITSQLVDQWKIPLEWILEAKALYARSQGDHFSCAKNLVLAKSLIEAQKTILTHIAPQAVISTHLSNLEELLLMFDSSPPAGWDVGGQIYLDYISLVQEHGTAERRRRGSGSKREIVVRLLRGLPAMEARSFEQRVAASEMARVVANIVVSSSEMSREVGGLMRLPLLEGDALRITRKVAGGMLDQILAG